MNFGHIAGIEGVCQVSLTLTFHVASIIMRIEHPICHMKKFSAQKFTHLEFLNHERGNT